MGRYVFRLPDIGEGVAEAEIAAWQVKAGDVVVEEQSLVDVMTDKATVDMTSPVSGRVLVTHGEVGQMVAVGAPLVEFETEDAAAEAESGPEPETAEAPRRPSPAPDTQDHPSVLAAPATRARAAAAGVALEEVEGKGPNGRITPADLDLHIRAQAAAQAAPADGVEEIRIVGLRRQIAERMQEAKRTIPHFGYVEEFDLTELERLRQSLNEDEATPGRPRLTLLPFLMLAVVRAVRAFPNVNARYDHEAGVLRRHDAVHIGVATHTPGGLLVPVVRHAETRDLWDCAGELQRLAQAARSGAARREELTGSTITLTSLGRLGGVAATPIINLPEVAILAPNQLVERPVVRAGQVTVRKMMNLSSAFDHRIVDGHDAAAFVQAIKRDLETPARLFIPHP